ncbi:citryl-CoA lyase [Pseudooceanicola sp. 216_PA32_1]|uniref:citrate synthase (unknown stereospecificity) n=1 Tax=Pseudooceanicola pacificus TaxID=2676438 RepID=A0A844WAF6_9RHOB|nr:citryl-CoA lyase [Pseudooceanicola pacificus]MWB77953.1 citryl-CoA lyase [Pseudooceanicola pacificus]
MDQSNDVASWWRTSIIDMEPGRIGLRGYDIADVIDHAGFVQMIWLMTRGDLPSPEQARLLERALVASVDHGPQAPSIAVARMAVTCGVGLNGAIASAVNLLDDVHGGAGEQAVELLTRVVDLIRDFASPEEAANRALDGWTAAHGPIVPGLGHRFHKDGDPRSPALLAAVDAARDAGVVSGDFALAARAVEAVLSHRKGRRIPINIDGATAVIFAELGFAGPLARGLFCLSRSVGILAHAWEQMQQGGRNKGPTPPAYRWLYDGAAPRRIAIDN